MSSQDVLVLAEIQGDTVADITLELLGAARAIVASTGGQVLVVVPSPDGERFTASLGAADRIVLVNDPLLSGYSPEPYLAVLQDVVSAEQPRAVLIGATSIGWDLAPLLAGRLQAPMLTGCQAIRVESDSLVVTASFCAGKMIAEVEISRSVKFWLPSF